MLVSVCICTFKRPSLERTLDSIANQLLPPEIEIELVIADNDSDSSGLQIVQSFNDKLNIHYTLVSEPNLSEVRNATLAIAKGELIAFIDDDEWAEKDWMSNLLKSHVKYEADAVMGAVLTQYPEAAPDWIVHGGLFNKPQFRAGKILTKGQTSNAILKRQWVNEKGFRFDKSFGKSGGEDTDFFHRLYKHGAKIVFDDTAIVTEEVEQHRLNLAYLIERNVGVGQVHWKYLWRHQRGLAFWKTGLFVVMQIVGAAVLYLFSLPFGKSKSVKWYLLMIRNTEKLKNACRKGIKDKDSINLYGKR